MERANFLPLQNINLCFMEDEPPQFAAHRSFVTNPQGKRCGAVLILAPAEQCPFVKSTPGCQEGVQFIDYINFLYCVLNEPWLFEVKLIALVLVCLYIFLILGSTADSFFCPVLAVISNRLGLSENLAGVTLLAFGNGAPDLVVAFSNYDGDTEMLYAQLIGGALYIIGFIGSTIILLHPFLVQPEHLIRDVCFFLLATVWIGVGFRNETFTYLEVNGTLAIYFLYLLVVLIDHLRTKAAIKRTSVLMQYDTSESLANQLRTLEQRHQFFIRKSSELETDASSQSASNDDRNELRAQFVNTINPIDADDWKRSGLLGRFCMVLNAPIHVILTLIIPCVDYTIPRNGWSKLLNCLQVVILPIAVLLMKKGYTIQIFGLSIFAFTIPITICLASAVYLTSVTYEPPKYHLFFAIFGSFVGSMCVISTMANELVAVLSTLGIVSDLSDSFLGLSVLAWGNSVGDLISNIALARKGYQRMAFAACFGGPLFNTLLGIGCTFNVKIYFSSSDKAYTREGALGRNCSYFLCCLLFFMLLAISLCHWQARRSIGVLMLSIYVIHMVYAIFGELQLMHPYGTDHQDEGLHVN